MANEIAMVLPNNERGLIAQAFMKSGLFSVGATRDHPIQPDVQLARAYVKIQAGHELGFPPFYSMQNFNIIQGKVTMSAEAMGAKIKASKRYDYTVPNHTDTECSIQFLVNSTKDYLSTFTIADAKRAGIYRADSGWAKYPKAMLMARALTQGARIVCPEILQGVITTEESEDREFIDPETGEIKQVESADLLKQPDPEKKAESQPKKKADKKARADKADSEKVGKSIAQDAEKGATIIGDNGAGHETENKASGDVKTNENGLFSGQETDKETTPNYPPDLPFDPSTIKDVSRLYKMIHDHCKINPIEAWRILGISNNPELADKYPTLGDAFIKVWDHYQISLAKE